MVAHIHRRRISDEDYERLFRIEDRPRSAFLSLPNTKAGIGKKAASATSKAGATAMKPFRRIKEKEGGESKAKRDKSAKPLISSTYFFDLFCALLCFPPLEEVAKA